MLTAIILAAGFSKRMNQDKLSLTINSHPIIEYTLSAISSSYFNEKILITRHNLFDELAKRYNFKSIKNYYSAFGQSKSIHLGVKMSSINNSYMFFVGDQPGISSETILKIQNTHFEHPDKIIIPTYLGKNCNPTIFPNKFRKDLLSISGDTGGRAIIQNNPNETFYIEINSPLSFLDIDTKENYETFLLQYSNSLYLHESIHR